jgi:hypothetical protein
MKETLPADRARASVPAPKGFGVVGFIVRPVDEKARAA